MGEVVAGRFELIDVLGSGGVGTVWRAWDRRQEEYVAAKVLRHGDSDSLLRFVREARRVIDHPRIVGPRSWTAEDDRVLFTMELVRGGSVATLVADHGALPQVWAVELARQAAEALAAVHDAGYAHRDVKPGNLLLDVTGRGRPRLRVSDFGAAVSFDEPRLTSTGFVLGTPGYLPPEAWLGADPAPGHDVFGLGVALGEMLTGEKARHRAEQSWLIEGGPGISPELRGLVADLTHPDPTARPAGMVEVVERLRTLPAFDEAAQDPGDPVEVFDQVPALPAGWSDAGPVPVPASPPAAVPPPVEAPTRLLAQGPPARTGLTISRWVPVLAVLGVALLVLAYLLA